MTLDRDRPEILQPPEHPQACCTQQTITVPPDVLAKTAQKHDYPSAAWRRSYARRSGAERGFATAKDPASNDIARGWCRLMGLAPLMLFTTTPARRPQPAHPRRLERPPGRKRPPRRQRPAPENPQAPPQDPHRAHSRRTALTGRTRPQHRHQHATPDTTTARSTPGHRKTRPGTAKRAPPAPSEPALPGQDHRPARNVRPKRETRPHTKREDLRVRRQGLEPRTRGLRVRCSGFLFTQSTSVFALVRWQRYPQLAEAHAVLLTGATALYRDIRAGTSEQTWSKHGSRMV